MKRLVWIACVLLSLVHSGSAQETSLSAKKLEQIKLALKDWQADKRVPGFSIAIGVDNEIVLQRGFGESDVENSVPATETTKYRTASVAKSMTAAMVLSLAESGQLDLDADVRIYCPEFPEKRWPFTMRQLLGHLSGVRHYKSFEETLSTKPYFDSLDAISTFKDDRLRHEPGTKYLYSTFGYNLLGRIAENVAKKPYYEILKQHVLLPANMNSTVIDSQYSMIPNRTRGYFRPSQRTLERLGADGAMKAGELYNASLHDTSVKIPAGGLLATPGDLVRFASALYNEEILRADTLSTMWASQRTSSGKATGYGLGWRVSNRNGRKQVWHTGGQSGTSTVLVVFPDERVSVAIMSNLQSSSPFSVATKIADIVVADPPQREVDYSAALEKLESVIAFQIREKDVPAFSISLVDGEDLVWAKGFGFQDSEKQVPATAETIYRVGSVSKLFTDIAVMQLEEQGSIDLDVPVHSYLPKFEPANPYEKPITLRQLMTHRSGLVRESPVGNYFDPTEPTLDATVESLNETKLVYEPETKTKYSNAAIAVVGKVLESLIDSTHAASVRTSILDPLKMDNSSFALSPSIEEKLAVGWMHTYDGRRFEAPKFLLGTGPAGNMYSNVLDMAKFLTCILKQGKTPAGQILTKDSFREMVTPIKDAEGESRSFGIGFHIQDLDGYTKIGHGGAVYGFSTQVEALPQRGIGVAAVSSLDGSNGLVRRIADYALRLMVAAEDGKDLPEFSTTTSVPQTRARSMAGTYQSKTGQVVQIEELNGELFLQRGVLRYRLGMESETGRVVTDDVTGFGVEVEVLSADRIKIGDEDFDRQSKTPASVPTRWRGLIGEYGWDHNTLYILEQNGQLYALIEWFYYYPLTEVDENTFEFPDYGLYHGEGLVFSRDEDGNATKVVAAEVEFLRREVGTKDGETFKIVPIKPIDDLREGALAATPPAEEGRFVDSNLVQLNELDPTIRLDIRYASTNNFTGAVFYQQPRAFMQSPAAEAVVRANAKLNKHGLGLLIHDAYRPWFVTKMFWDATPAEMKDFVANPKNGSRHNRGCAVDLTLYDLASGEPIPMVAGYDEFSERSFPQYPGGTSRARWYRTLLRETMESEGFTIYEYEWWHFDYQDWQKYRIGNETFEQILDQN